MGLILIRIIFTFVGTLLGHYVSTQLDDQVSKMEGMAIGFAVAVGIILTEFLFRRVALKVIIGGILGFIIGLPSANIIAAPLKLVQLERSIVNFLVLLMNAFFGYMGVTIGIREGERFNPANIKKLFKGGEDEHLKILDTSVIIDGRIPYRDVRDEMRRAIGRFVEVYVEAPIDVLKERDVKGLYRKALAGEIKQFTGVDDPYEPPLSPEVVCHTDGRATPEQSAAKVIRKLEELGYIPVA